MTTMAFGLGKLSSGQEPQDFAEKSRFPFVYFFSVGIPILNIVLSHVHMWLTSNVIH